MSPQTPGYSSWWTEFEWQEAKVDRTATSLSAHTHIRTHQRCLQGSDWQCRRSGSVTVLGDWAAYDRFKATTRSVQSNKVWKGISYIPLWIITYVFCTYRNSNIKKEVGYDQLSYDIIPQKCCVQWWIQTLCPVTESLKQCSCVYAAVCLSA